MPRSEEQGCLGAQRAVRARGRDDGQRFAASALVDLAGVGDIHNR